MRRLLGTLALVLAVGGCGSDGADVPTGDSPPSTDGTASRSTVVLVSATAGGGGPASTATDVGDDGALASYLEQFTSGFADRIRAAAGRIEVDDGETLVAQVVSIGCDKPLEAELTAHAAGWDLVPTPVPTPRMECLAPVTTVGLAAVPATATSGS